MVVIAKEDGDFEYTYKMKKGISKVKGAFLILKQMDYPAEILEDMTKWYDAWEIFITKYRNKNYLFTFC